MQTVSLAVTLRTLEQVKLGSGRSPLVLRLSRHGTLSTQLQWEF